LRWQDVWCNRNAFNGSDIRLKKDVKTTEYGLTEVMKLRPVNYTWRDNDRKDLGFIAQEIKEILPELVLVSDDEMNTLLMYYNGVIPVLVKAMQEQQKIIENQSAAIELLKAENKDIQELKASISEKLKELNDLQKQIENKIDRSTEAALSR
jgi:predicted phage tail protein